MDGPDRALFGRVSHSTRDLLLAVLAATHPPPRRDLATQARPLHPAMRAALQALGRPADERGTEITLARPLADLPPERRTIEIGAFRLGHEAIDAALRDTELSFVAPLRDRPVYPPPAPATATAGWRAETNAQLLVATGPYHVIYDHADRPMPACTKPAVIVCSVPGINFAYSAADGSRYAPRGRLDEPRAKVRMKVILAHVMERMSARGVAVPVLCAIGCGAFCGNNREIVGLWAEAAATVLSQQDYGFRAVVFCLVGGTDNYERFVTGVAPFATTLRTPVLLLRDRDMLEVADTLVRRHGVRSGVLNPADWQTMVNGKAGLYWDGGHVALEELMAVKGTLLLQHVGLNPGLWTTERAVPAYLYPELVEEARRLDPDAESE